METEDETHLLMIDGGFAQMVDNKLTILTEQATRATEIDREAARRALEEAMARVAQTAEGTPSVAPTSSGRGSW